MNELAQVNVPGTDRTVLAALIDGVVQVSPRHVCDAIGIDADAQIRRLKRTSWACTSMMTVQPPGDAQRRELVMIDRRTFTMWLATIDTSRVKDETARGVIEAFQREAADALDRYFNEGGAINPSATTDQLERIGRIASIQAGVLNALKGIVDPKHLEAKGRVVLARALGEAPELDELDVPLYVTDYLKGKGLQPSLITAKAPGFGKRLKALYTVEHDREPEQHHQELPNGTVRKVNSYTEADRHLFDKVWARHYANLVAT